MKFADVHVPEEIKRHLIESVLHERISHAQIFYGMEGTHSLALALAYAQYVNCSDRTEEDSCGHCASCQKFEHLAHPDLHFFFPHPASEKSASPQYYDEWRALVKERNALFSVNDWYNRIGMDNKQGFINKTDIDLILEKNALKPFESAYKVFIIYLPERIQPKMAHKLLKSLEEPEGKTLYILVTENYDQVLGTITSRTQLTKIKRFSTEELAAIIQKVQGCDTETAMRKAALSDHNLITALQEGDGSTSDFFPLFQEMMRYAYMLSHPTKNFDFKNITQWIDKMGKLGREQQKHFLQYGLALIRKCMLKNIHLDSMAVSTEEENEWMGKFMPFIHTDNITPFYSIINEAIHHIEANANTKLLFMDLLLSLGKYLNRQA